jgi:hypothetical protein
MCEVIKKRLKKLPDDVIIINDEIIINDKNRRPWLDFEMAICLLYEIPFDGKFKYCIVIFFFKSFSNNILFFKSFSNNIFFFKSFLNNILFFNFWYYRFFRQFSNDFIVIFF